MSDEPIDSFQVSNSDEVGYVSKKAYLDLLAERDSLVKELRELRQIHRLELSSVRSEGRTQLAEEFLEKALELNQVIEKEREQARAKSDAQIATIQVLKKKAALPDPRSNATYLRIIGAMVNLMQEKTPDNRPISVYQSQNAIKEALLAYFPNLPGISARTLDKKFAEAKKLLANE